jgi:hypothetical protein
MVLGGLSSLVGEDSQHYQKCSVGGKRVRQHKIENTIARLLIRESSHGPDPIGMDGTSTLNGAVNYSFAPAYLRDEVVVGAKEVTQGSHNNQKLNALSATELRGSW